MIVWDLPLPTHEKMVAVWLDHFGFDQVFHYGVASFQCGMSEKAFRQSLSELEQRGLVVVDPWATPDTLSVRKGQVWRERARRARLEAKESARHATG